MTGDAFAGQTFRADFQELGIIYEVCRLSKSEIYEAIEPKLNAGEVELLDDGKLQEQLLTLVIRGARIDHMPGDHDDFANAGCGAVWLVSSAPRAMHISTELLAWAATPARRGVDMRY